MVCLRNPFDEPHSPGGMDISSPCKKATPVLGWTETSVCSHKCWIALCLDLAIAVGLKFVLFRLWEFPHKLWQMLGKSICMTPPSEWRMYKECQGLRPLFWSHWLVESDSLVLRSHDHEKNVLIKLHKIMNVQSSYQHDVLGVVHTPHMTRVQKSRCVIPPWPP
jgi:hypothetical protein